MGRQVKVITGIRRCGKSYLLRTLFKNYLLQTGVKAENIISVELDLTRDIRFRNPLELSAFVSEKVRESGEKFYLFVDEIQLSDAVKNPYNPEGKRITFYDALNDFREFENLDVYVTGSNSKMLSSDIRKMGEKGYEFLCKNYLVSNTYSVIMNHFLYA